MRLNGWNGLAVAVMKQAAHDYVEYLRWMRDKAMPIDCEAELKRMSKYAKRHGISLLAPGIKEERLRMKKQLTVQQNIEELEAWFQSNEFHVLSTIDGENFMHNIQKELKADPSYRILLGDDF